MTPLTVLTLCLAWAALVSLGLGLMAMNHDQERGGK